jgi:uncharacterized protein (TIGR03437 family)
MAVLGTVTLGSSTSLTPGAGNLVVSSFPCVGAHSIVGAYSGDSNYSSGASQPLLETIIGQLASTTTKLGSSPNPTVVGQSVTLTAELQYTFTQNTFPKGTVTFTDVNTGNVLGSGNVQTSGTGLGQVPITEVSINTSALPAGSNAVHAAYSGDNIYAASTSPVLNQIVNGMPTSVSPSISPGGIVTASAFGAFSSIAPGGWIEIYGSNLAGKTRSWTFADFNGQNAPTSLEGTSVTVGGQATFIGYISPSQVNVQVAYSVAPGPQHVTLTTAVGPSAPFTVTVNPTQPGLLAPASFLAAGKQYVAALFPDGSYALPPGTVPGVNCRPAKAGDIITLWGVGFGPVIPDMPAGQIVGKESTLASSVQFLIGDTPAAVSYAGLAPGEVGEYQFNITVPNVAPGDLVPLSFTLDGVKGNQTLYIAVGN